MNYRHVFHAGNHADVFKHAALTLALERLLAKPQPFAVLDTHAGVGVYDLTSEQAQKTGEAQDGAGRILERGLASAAGYAELLQAMNPDGLKAYPGSPEIVRRMLRDEDRLICCELHPQDAETLKSLYREDRRVAVHHRDGYEAMGALLPPAARRGLVLTDPPFEKTDEARSLARALTRSLKRWPTGTFVIWYPIKDGRIGEALTKTAYAEDFPKALKVEFSPYGPNETSLPGSGLLICNTPYQLDEKLKDLCQELTGVLGTGRGSWSVDWLTEP
jgi:23S rRNA (adenine2030-N6)-methyltransferase